MRGHHQSLFAIEKAEVTEVPGVFVQDYIGVNQNQQKGEITSQGATGLSLSCPGQSTPNSYKTKLSIQFLKVSRDSDDLLWYLVTFRSRILVMFD